MTPMFAIETLELLARETPLADPEYGEYCRANASVIVANKAEAYAWIGLDALGQDAPVVLAPRQAVMIAEQLAKRAYANPDAIVAEGGIGPIGGDRTVEDFARTFELTPDEEAYLLGIAIANGGGGQTGNRLWTVRVEVRPPALVGGATIWLRDIDARAKAWPVGTEGVDTYAYGEPV